MPGCLGSGLPRTRGLGADDRPTHDIDLFAHSTLTATQFADALTRAKDLLTGLGLEVELVRSYQLFARLSVRDDTGDAIEVDMAVNWRAEPPVMLRLGPSLAEADAVAGKLSAVYSRGEVRDFLDLNAIRSSGRYSDEQLFAWPTSQQATQRSTASPPIASNW